MIDFFGRDEDGTPNGYVGTAAAGNYMFGVAGIDPEAMKLFNAELERVDVKLSEAVNFEPCRYSGDHKYSLC